MGPLTSPSSVQCLMDLLLCLRSSSSIDHLHSKRDSAYSSFSTSSSIPEYLAAPSSSPERSCSLENVLHQGGGSDEMQHVNIRYMQTACGAPGLEPGSAPSSSSRRSRELQGNVMDVMDARRVIVTS